MCGRCCYTMLKASVCSVNLLVMLVGGLLTAAGVSLLVTEHLYLETTWDQFSMVSYFLLAAGLLTLTLSFLACCGSLVSSKCLLATFILSILCLVVAEATLAVLVYFQVNWILQNILCTHPPSSLTHFLASWTMSCLLYFLPCPTLNTCLLNLPLLFLLLQLFV